VYHKLIIVGYLGSDPELRYTSSGQAVTNMSVATSRRWTDSDGEQHDETIWWRVAVWGKQAEVCDEYLSKGRPVLVEGRIGGDRIERDDGTTTVVPHTWTGQDGEPRAQFEMTAMNVRFLGGRDRGGGGRNRIPGGLDEAPADTAEEEIPF
jgi:single-strand DNA-binding protein